MPRQALCAMLRLWYAACECMVPQLERNAPHNADLKKVSSIVNARPGLKEVSLNILTFCHG